MVITGVERNASKGFRLPGSTYRQRGKVRVGRLVGALLAAILLMGLCASTASAATRPSSSGSIDLTASSTYPAHEIGITPTTIRIGMIADVNTPVQPGLFKQSVQEVQAWAAIVNRHGGLAGRKVVIDFCDSMLNPNTTTNCVIRACANDFAMITAAIELSDVSDIADCKNAEGDPVGIPNSVGLALNPYESCSPSVLTATDTTFCKTLNDHPQTYSVLVADTRYYLSHFKDLHGIWIYDGDVPDLTISYLPGFVESNRLGIGKDAEGYYTAADAAPESALLPFVEDIKQYHSTFVLDGVSPGSMILLRREAALQGVNTVKVWACNPGCYDTSFLAQGGSVVNGTYTYLTTLPFYSECQINPTLVALVKQLGGKGCSVLQGNALYSFIAALLLQDGIQKVVSTGKVLNRQNLYTATRTLHTFDADGITGPEDIGGGKAAYCIVMVKVINGKWQRVFPKKPGTFDCSPDNSATIKLNENF